MLESVVELLGGLMLTALPLLIGSCIVGSIVAEAKKRKLQETKGRPNHRGGLLYIVGLKAVALARSWDCLVNQN
jgi:hypothetical protein